MMHRPTKCEEERMWNRTGIAHPNIDTDYNTMAYSSTLDWPLLVPDHTIQVRGIYFSSSLSELGGHFSPAIFHRLIQLGVPLNRVGLRTNSIKTLPRESTFDFT